MEQCFSTNLRNLMKVNNITQERIAEIANVTRQSVNQWLNKKTLPTLQSVLAIAEHFNVSVEQLVYRSESFKSSCSIPRRFFPICTGLKNNRIVLERNWSESYVITNNIPVDADFCFIMYDDSMSNNRIEKGDIVVVKETSEPKDNDLALCVLDEMLVFRRYCTTQKGEILLIASNPKYQNYVVTKDSAFSVIGIATVFRGRI